MAEFQVTSASAMTVEHMGEGASMGRAVLAAYYREYETRGGYRVRHATGIDGLSGVFRVYWPGNALNSTGPDAG